jgi:PhnB protein
MTTETNAETPASSLTTKTTLRPHLVCRNANEAIEFYKMAFGAECACVIPHRDGRVMHAGLSIDGAEFFLVDEFPEHGGHSPLALGGTPVTIHLQVPDCDAFFQRAVDAGCEVRLPLQDMFWGDRYGIVSDPYGHQWSIATTVREVSMEELQQAATSCM